jgi:thioredoxin reductase
VLLALVAVELLWGFGMTAFETFTPVRLADVLGDPDRAAALLGPTNAAAWLISSAGAGVAPTLTRRLGAAQAGAMLRVAQGVTVVAIALASGPIGVIATGPMSIHHGLLLPDWGPTTLLVNGAFEPDEDQLRQLAGRGAKVEYERIVRLSGEADVELADGRKLSFAGLFTATRTAPNSPLAQQLDCRMEEGPLGHFIWTDAMKQTSIPGVIACGDAARGAGNVALAVGDGAMAGAMAHRSLIFP